ncbi:MAG: hypothetical protein PUE44_08655 [Bulleidia sp.]|nr:hypothetical protein [Erysipelotrichaceae bacterium]MDD6664448.1 hypothetical protein [Bulleidia sp.]MDY4809929.1 hypothetical protein [Bulleidia sp.]
MLSAVLSYIIKRHFHAVFMMISVDLTERVIENESVRTGGVSMGNNPLAVLGLFSSFHLTDPDEPEQEEILDFALNDDEIPEEDNEHE